MKKEGTGKPRNPDISLDADVRMRELSFQDVPDPEVFFRGSTERNSVWESKRENLPAEVQNSIIYRDARVRLRIATEIVISDPGFWNSSDQNGVEARSSLDGERVKENPGSSG